MAGEHYLHTLRWLRLRLELTNTRNIYAREHPLAIFESVFKEARQLSHPPLTLDYVFHAAGYCLPERIQKRQSYPLELIFFGAAPADIALFLENLRQHLKNPHNNFTLSSQFAPEERSLAMLLAEQPPPPATCSEICLEFLSPFPFTPPLASKHKGRHWRSYLDTPTLVQELLKRVARAFNLQEEPAPDPAWDAIQTLPYYWTYRQSRHKPKSNDGTGEFINGAIGPLYLKGPIAEVYPLLLLCSEIHASRSPAKGRGYFQLRQERPFFDGRLARENMLQRAYDTLIREDDAADALLSELIAPDSFLGGIREEIVSGQYQPEAFHGFTVAKKSGGERLIATAAPRDQLVLKMLHMLLGPVLDRMFEACSIGYRRGHSRHQAKSFIAEAVRAGYTHVLEADVAAFFDAISWETLTDKLRAALPEADVRTLTLIKGFIEAELVVGGKRVARSQGLIQGMALSPMLANLYLDSFDEEMGALGYRMLRYGDDFILLCRSSAESSLAEQHARAVLQRLGLELKKEKTRITVLDKGFRFLGFDFGPDLDEEFIERTALRKTVFIRPLYALAGIDGDTLVVRKEQQCLLQVPMNRIGEVIILGDNTVSSRLLHRCTREGIPVSFCQAGGKYINTLRPDSKSYFDLAALHAKRFQATGADEQLAIARRIAQAKLSAYACWLADRYGASARELCSLLQTSITAMAGAQSIAALRGSEGRAAGAVLAFVRGVIPADFLASGKRQPRVKADPWNVLVDFLSSLLFARLNVLLRSQGLNPYLGFLHSHKDDYESLVCDLQEPFRARMDRLAIRLLNRRMLRGEHFLCAPLYNHTWSLSREGLGIVLEAFARELELRLSGDGGSLVQLLVAQVQALRLWVLDESMEFAVYRPDAAMLRH